MSPARSRRGTVPARRVLRSAAGLGPVARASGQPERGWRLALRVVLLVRARLLAERLALVRDAQRLFDERGFVARACAAADVALGDPLEYPDASTPAPAVRSLRISPAMAISRASGGACRAPGPG